jgi:hypothetical protein
MTISQTAYCRPCVWNSAATPNASPKSRKAEPQ